MILIKRLLAFLTAIFIVTLSFTSCNNEQTVTPEDSENLTPATQMLVGATELDINPLTGEELESSEAAGTRPIAIMVNNSEVSLPQRGLASADAILEMGTEGGITRLMAFYSQVEDIPQVGSVRSARDQHLQFAMPLNAIVVHIGTSVYASNLLNTYSYKTIDGRYQGTTSFWFDELRATSRAQEHCWYTDAALIQTGISQLGIETQGKGYPIVNFTSKPDDVYTPKDGESLNVEFKFSDFNTTSFTYNSETSMYNKFVYGAAHSDEEGDQLAFDNVILLFSHVGLKDDNYCSDYDLISGTGYYIYGGAHEKITWEKGAPDSPLIISDANGRELDINTGKTYIGVVAMEFESTIDLNKGAPAA